MEPRHNLFAVTPANLDQSEMWSFTPPSVIVGALVIFVTAFLLGLWCGWMWQQRRVR